MESSPKDAAVAPSPGNLVRYYRAFAMRRRISFENAEDVAQEMFCVALENEIRLGIPHFQQDKWFLFSRSMKRLFRHGAREKLEFSVLHAENLWDWLDSNWANTTPDGRRFLKKYRVTANQVEIDLDAWEIIDFMNAHNHVAPINVVSNLKKHPHIRWLADGKLWASKKAYAEATGREKIYRAKPKLIEGQVVEVRIK